MVSPQAIGHGWQEQFGLFFGQKFALKAKSILVHQQCSEKEMTIFEAQKMSNNIQVCILAEKPSQ